MLDISNEFNDSIHPLNVATQAAIDIALVIELKKQFDNRLPDSLAEDAKQMIRISLESLDVRYNCNLNLGLESSDTLAARIKEIIKKIIQAIVNTVERVIAELNGYRISGNAIIDRASAIEHNSKGHIGSQRRNLFVESNQLATTLFLSKGGGNPREAYKKVIDIATKSYDIGNFSALEHVLKELQTATDDQSDVIAQQLLKTITGPIRQILTNSNPPAFLSDRNTRENSDLICAGPFLGERYLFAYCPRDTKHINEFHIGTIRDHDAMIVKERLPALATTDIWDICERATRYGELIIEFAAIDIKLKRLTNLAKDLIKNVDAPHVVALAAVIPSSIKGLQYTALNMGVDTTFAMLEYCAKSIKAQIAVEK